MKKVAICGRITGDPNWIEKFNKKYDELSWEHIDWLITTPVDSGAIYEHSCIRNGETPTEAGYFANNLKWIADFDVFYFLKDWCDMPLSGSTIEYNFALRYDKEIIFEVPCEFYPPNELSILGHA